MTFQIYKNGFHSDLSETYLIGKVDAAGRRLVEIARRCRDEAIMQCGPYIPMSVIGDTIGWVVHWMSLIEIYLKSPSRIAQQAMK